MKTIVLLFSSLLLLTACGKKGFQKAEGDMYYIIHEDKNGTTIKEDDFLGITYSQRTEEDSVLENTYDYDGRIFLTFCRREAFKGDFFSGLKLLSEGDSATFKINLDSVVARENLPRPRTKGKYLLYHVKVNKVVARGTKSDDEFAAAIEAARVEQFEIARKAEDGKLKNYLASLKARVFETASGLKYTFIQKGEGRTAKLGDTVRLNYTGRYLSGRMFETSSSEVAKKENMFNPGFKYPPVKWKVKKEEFMTGFKESMLLFPKGSKVRLIIPSRLAYGKDGYKTIRGYTPILCDIEILDIIPPSDGKP